MNLSLSQHIAQAGGICSHDTVLQGELDQCRDLNKLLRGRNSVLRPSGLPLDVIARDCHDAGYPVSLDSSGDFLGAVEADARAWANGSDRDRVWIDFDLSPAACEAYDAEYESWLMESEMAEQVTLCAVCDRVAELPIHSHGDVLCPSCAMWGEAFTAQPDAFASIPAIQLPQEARLALTEALSTYIDE